LTSHKARKVDLTPYKLPKRDGRSDVAPGRKPLKLLALSIFSPYMRIHDAPIEYQIHTKSATINYNLDTRLGPSRTSQPAGDVVKDDISTHRERRVTIGSVERRSVFAIDLW
jgi:hypothetical protein